MIKKLFNIRSKYTNQDGAVLVIALLLLVVLTVMGISIQSITSTDIQIAGNEKCSKIAFFNTDSGVNTTPKVISLAIDSAGNPDLSALPSLDYLAADGVTVTDEVGSTFYNEIMGFAANDAVDDIRLNMSSYNVNVDVQRTGASSLAGGGVEFASGSEGVGVGSSSSTAINYTLSSTGAGPQNAQSNIIAGYRKVVGTGGGL